MIRLLGNSLRILIGVVALLLIVFAFGWVITRPLRNQQASKNQVVLRILQWGDKEEDRIVADLVRAFEQANPDIRVIRTNTGSPAQLATKLQTMLAAGDPPDLFYLMFDKVANVGSKDVLENIEPYIARDRETGAKDTPDLNDFFPAVLDAFRYEPATHRIGVGPLVGLPKGFTPVGFYYNKTLFDRAGVPYPPRAGWTWDQFLDAARKIGKLENCYGAEIVTWESMMRIFLYTHGLDVAEPGFQGFRLSDPRVVATLDELRTWFNDGTRTLLSAKTQLETGQVPFLTGKIGLAGPFGCWQIPLYRRIDTFDWDFAPLPHAEGQPPTNGVLTVAWCMAKAGRHKEESWRLMKFLLSRQGQEMICSAGLELPALKSVAFNKCLVIPNARPETDEVFLNAALVAKPVEWPADNRYMDELRTAFENIYKLGRPTQPELASAEKTWKVLASYTGNGPKMPWGTIALVVFGALVPLLAFGLWRWVLTRPGKLARQEELAGYTMLSPWVIGFIAFCAFPIVLSLLLGFTRWNAMQTLDQAEWVGTDNFRELLTFDQKFRESFWITVWYAVLAVPSSQLAALIAAMLLSRETRSVGVFRAIWYLPSVLAGVGMAILWKWVFHHEHGLLNTLLEPVANLINQWFHTSLTPPRWFEHDAGSWGVPAFAIINLWVIGGTMMIYLAGLKGIPKDLYEAAEIDGATGLRRFRNVTLPMLSPVIFFNTIMAIIASFQIFTQVYVMTGGGPGTATQFYVFYLYKNAFDLGAMGYASAMAWLLLLIVLGLTLLIMRGSQRFVYYEALK